MANDLRYVVEKKEDGTWKGFGAFKTDMNDFPTGRYMITCRKYIKSRSNKQNRFYWGNFMQEQIECFKERWGETYRKEQIHDWNKANFWSEDHINEITGEVIKKPASSTNNDTFEWEQKMEQIRQWFRQVMEWELPFPEQQSKINY